MPLSSKILAISEVDDPIGISTLIFFVLSGSTGFKADFTYRKPDILPIVSITTKAIIIIPTILRTVLISSIRVIRLFLSMFVFFFFDKQHPPLYHLVYYTKKGKDKPE